MMAFRSCCLCRPVIIPDSLSLKSNNVTSYLGSKEAQMDVKNATILNLIPFVQKQYICYLFGGPRKRRLTFHENEGVIVFVTLRTF